MSGSNSREPQRWRRMVLLALGLAAIGFAAAVVHVIGYRQSIRPYAGRLQLAFHLLTGLWWAVQGFYWLVVGGTVGWVVWRWTIRLVRMSAINTQNALNERHTRHGTAAQPQPRRRQRLLAAFRQACFPALTTLILLEVMAAGVLWWEEQPKAAPSGLAPAAPGEFRIAAIGSSSAAGYPYRKEHAFTAIVAWQLRQMFPDLNVVAENLAEPGRTLETAYRDLHRLRVVPHVLLVYSGHNEFLSRYHLDCVAEEDSFPRPSFLARAVRSRLEGVRVEQDRVAGRVVDNLARAKSPLPLFDRAAFTPAELDKRHRNFRRHLEATVHWCRRYQILPILIIPACNESSFEPCRSALPREFPAAKESRLRGIYSRLEQGEPDLAERQGLLEEARELCPTFALTWFHLGQVYEAQGRYAQARHGYQKALARDEFPWHLTAAHAEIYREVAARWKCPLLDARELLRPLAPDGILGDELFHDVVHPSLASHAAIARGVLEELRALGVPKSADAWPTTIQIDVAAFAEASKLDSGVWLRVCEQVATSLSMAPRWHFEEALRRRKAEAYMLGRRAIRAGTPPEQTGLPGIGIEGAKKGGQVRERRA